MSVKEQPEAIYHKRSDVDLLLFYMTLKENLKKKKEIKNLHILHYLTFVKVAPHQELEVVVNPALLLSCQCLFESPSCGPES